MILRIRTRKTSHPIDSKRAPTGANTTFTLVDDDGREMGVKNVMACTIEIPGRVEPVTATLTIAGVDLDIEAEVAALEDGRGGIVLPECPAGLDDDDVSCPYAGAACAVHR